MLPPANPETGDRSDMTQSVISGPHRRCSNPDLVRTRRRSTGGRLYAPRSRWLPGRERRGDQQFQFVPRYWSGTPPTVGRPVEAISSKVLRIGVEMELPRAHPGDVNRTIDNRMKLLRTRREFFNRPLSRHHSFLGVLAQTTAACCGRATTSCSIARKSALSNGLLAASAMRRASWARR